MQPYSTAAACRPLGGPSRAAIRFTYRISSSTTPALTSQPGLARSRLLRAEGAKPLRSPPSHICSDPSKRRRPFRVVCTGCREEPPIQKGKRRRNEAGTLSVELPTGGLKPSDHKSVAWRLTMRADGGHTARIGSTSRRVRRNTRYRRTKWLTIRAGKQCGTTAGQLALHAAANTASSRAAGSGYGDHAHGGPAKHPPNS